MEQSLMVYHLCNLFSSHSPILACQTVEYSLFNLHIVNNLKCANFAQVVTKVRKIRQRRLSEKESYLKTFSFNYKRIRNPD